MAIVFKFSKNSYPLVGTNLKLIYHSYYCSTLQSLCHKNEEAPNTNVFSACKIITIN